MLGIKLQLLVFCILTNARLVAGDCSAWFKKAGLQSKKDCYVLCVSHPTDLSTFMCPAECNKLCAGSNPVHNSLTSLLYYPGLTQKEKQFIAKNPKDALKAFFAKELAEAATYKRFGRNSTNDESDAFRHFLWAGLLAKDLGPDLAKAFLDAHESEEDNLEERAMDLANNRAGLLSAENLKRLDKLNQENLENEALKSLQEGNLIVLKPKGVKK